ncbi:hypothetical protein [Polymorphum gilvum]|uniref:Uncharacterized protein n=1 Tax=Polymorphum gilvum (strain LMG 25793 / CGMCC 1.9160 / SL003B-26A1) TaxID=991905 RepID=F2J0Q1_POLGS|nr:hypothetical protein [Polymorphum gilvum]ADZ70737.1 hypothetical protein SL003B_2312 [Polymorphum gilvum SL003B-26A1]
MRKYLAALLLLALASDRAWSQSLPNPGDFFLIARLPDGKFHASHKVLSEAHADFREVRYCGRSFWVRPLTVAWTQVEAQNNREVTLEFNEGRGWLPICANPEKQVTLADIGIIGDPFDILRLGETTVQSENRFSAIRRSFSDITIAPPQRPTYHSR